MRRWYRSLDEDHPVPIRKAAHELLGPLPDERPAQMTEAQEQR